MKKQYIIATGILCICFLGSFSLEAGRTKKIIRNKKIDNCNCTCVCGDDQTNKLNQAKKVEKYTWPNESNTGPSGTLTLHKGDIGTTHDGQVIKDMKIYGTVDVRHNNVTIRNCEIYGSSKDWNVIFFNGMGIQKARGCVVEYCKIIGNGVKGCGIFGKNYTIRYCEILNMPQPVKVTNGTVVIESNYIHDLHGVNPGMHNDGIITNGDADRTDPMNITVRNNNIIAYTTDGMGATSGAICLWGDFGPIKNWLIEHNRLASDSYYILAAGCSGKPYGKGENIRVINNVFVFSKVFKGSRQNAWGDFEEVRGNHQSGNIWEDTGEAAPPMKMNK